MSIGASYPQANCKVSGGNLSDWKDDTKRPMSVFKSHNFTDKVDILLTKRSYDEINFSKSKLVNLNCYHLQCTLGSLLSESMLLIVRRVGHVVKLRGLDQSFSQPILISIINNKFCITVDREHSLQIGIQMSRSQFKNVMNYNFVLDLTKKDLASDLSFLKLLKFLQSVDTVYEFALIVQDPAGVPIALSETEINGFKSSAIEFIVVPLQFNVTEHINVLLMDMTIQEKDLEWAVEIMEYLDYLNLGGQQLTTPVDQFISQYAQSVDLVTRQDIVKLSFTNSIVPNSYLVRSVVDMMSPVDGWCAILTHGVVNTNYSFGMSEHVVHENGENNTCYLQNDGKYVVWEIVGGRDNY